MQPRMLPLDHDPASRCRASHVCSPAAACPCTRPFCKRLPPPISHTVAGKPQVPVKVLADGLQQLERVHLLPRQPALHLQEPEEQRRRLAVKRMHPELASRGRGSRARAGAHSLAAAAVHTGRRGGMPSAGSLPAGHARRLGCPPLPSAHDTRVRVQCFDRPPCQGDPAAQARPQSLRAASLNSKAKPDCPLRAGRLYDSRQGRQHRHAPTGQSKQK